jgi:hypothetical protein
MRQFIGTVTAKDEAVAVEPCGCVAPNRYASLGVIHIEHFVFRRVGIRAVAKCKPQGGASQSRVTLTGF